MNTNDRDEDVTLGVLRAVETDTHLTQRSLAARLGVALGLANSYLKRCARKGYIKVQQAPANRYAYYLTPKGFSEKSRLTARYFSASFALYRSTSQVLDGLFTELEAAPDCQSVVFVGATEIAEIAYLRAQECGLEVVGVYDPEAERARLAGIQVTHELGELPVADLVLLTMLDPSPELCAGIRRRFGVERIVEPDYLAMLDGSEAEGAPASAEDY